MARSPKKAEAQPSGEAPPSSKSIPRSQLVATAVLLLLAGVVTRYGWDYLRYHLAHSKRYQLTSSSVFVIPEERPPWIRSDVKGEVLRDADLANSTSLLDDPQEIHQRLVGAFEIHPWIEKVERVELVGPQRVEVHVRYRRPVAVVRVTSDTGPPEYLTVDASATRLPDNDLTEVEKSYMPRLVGVEGRPLVGEPWTDLRVVGGVHLASRLQEVWERYRLMEIVPSPAPEVVRSQRYFTYNLRTTGGTIIRWGAAPHFEPPSESSFAEKLDRLAKYIDEFGPLDSVTGPEEIDVRHQMTVKMRVAQQPETAGESERR